MFAGNIIEMEPAAFRSGNDSLCAEDLSAGAGVQSGKSCLEFVRGIAASGFDAPAREDLVGVMMVTVVVVMAVAVPVLVLMVVPVLMLEVVVVVVLMVVVVLVLVLMVVVVPVLMVVFVGVAADGTDGFLFKPFKRCGKRVFLFDGLSENASVKLVPGRRDDCSRGIVLADKGEAAVKLFGA